MSTEVTFARNELYPLQNFSVSARLNGFFPLENRAIGAEDSSVPASRTGTTRVSYNVLSVS